MSSFVFILESTLLYHKMLFGILTIKIIVSEDFYSCEAEISCHRFNYVSREKRGTEIKKKGNFTRERKISEMEIGKEYRVKKDEVDIKWVQSVDL